MDHVLEGGEGGEIRDVNGSERECGMWPDDRDGRGSGESPVHLWGC